jgi:hypothetical protein
MKTSSRKSLVGLRNRRVAITQTGGSSEDTYLIKGNWDIEMHK